MDIFESCNSSIARSLNEVNQCIESQRESQGSENELLHTQTIIEAVIADRDKSLDRILEQQSQIKMIIERDGCIKSLRRAIADDKRAQEELRRTCAKMGLDAVKNRHYLLETNAKDLERFQMQQLKSIAEDYQRHQNILEQRKKEIIAIKKETENEENNRPTYLANVEKNLEKQLQDRKQMGQSLSSFNTVTDEVHDSNHLELASIDEYAPYGAASHSRMSNSNPPKRGGSARGRKRKQT